MLKFYGVLRLTDGRGDMLIFDYLTRFVVDKNPPSAFRFFVEFKSDPLSSWVREIVLVISPRWNDERLKKVVILALQSRTRESRRSGRRYGSRDGTEVKRLGQRVPLRRIIPSLVHAFGRKSRPRFPHKLHGSGVSGGSGQGKIRGLKGDLRR